MTKHSEEQFKRLADLLHYLKNNNAYWNQRLASYDDDALKDPETAKKIYRDLRVVPKSEILDNYENYLDNSVVEYFRCRSIPLKEYLLNTKDLNKNHDKYFKDDDCKYTVETTSGTTGKPFPIVKNSRERMIAASYLLKCRKEHCPEANVKNGFLLAHEVDDFLRNTNYLNEKSDMHEVVDYFLEKKPKWIFVTANTLKRFTGAIKKHGKTNDVSKLDINFIEVTAAKLEDEEREEFEHIYNAPIRNQYGCREVWNIAYECKCGKLHINDSNLMVDLVDDDGNIIEDEDAVGEVIVTSLYNKMTPFIKYYLGDYARIRYEQCDCGKTSPILELQGGRKCERLKNTSYFGTAVFRRVLRVLYFNKNLRYGKVRIVQDEDFHLTVYLESCSDFEAFKSKFVEISSVIIEKFDRFKVDFIPEYPFSEQKSFLKDSVFISKI